MGNSLAPKLLFGENLPILLLVAIIAWAQRAHRFSTDLFGYRRNHGDPIAHQYPDSSSAST
ncbi:MAG: hypothetical protein QF489_04600 [Planctomycetota bacterium]|nr:hypothetical protein [Planctomycetota bacterium]